jgi:protein-tyrosine phosphatase
VFDLHAHILPGLDDGPPSEDVAVEMARVAVASGTRAIATTSHVDRRHGLTPEVMAAAREALAARLGEEGIDLELLAGGEVAPERLPALEDEELQAFSLGGGGTVLLECPFAPVGTAMELMVAELARRGFGVLLAHPERSPTFQREPARLARVLEAGAAAQVTAGSLAGGFGTTVTQAAFGLLEAGLVHVIASDAHDPRRRLPDLRLGTPDLRERYGDVEEQVRWMTETAPAALVAGRPLPDRPPLPRRRGMLSRLRRASSAR